MDRIFLRDLRVETVIGVWDWERQTKQIVSLDLEMATDARKTIDNDSIEHALNYRDVAKKIISFIEQSRFQLVESMAEAVASIIVRDFGVEWTRVSIAKPSAIAGSREVGIVIERTTSDYA